MVDVARDRNHHSLRGVAANMERMQLRSGHRGNRCDTADHGPADRVRAEHGRQENVAESVLRVVVTHSDLLEHHSAFEFDVLDRTRTPQHDVGDQVDGQVHVAVKDVRVVAGVFAGRERVQLTADRVHRLGDLHRAARRGGLEQQVLEEVRGAGDAGPFIARTDAHPHTDGRGAHRRDVFGDDAQSTGQDGAPHCDSVAPSLPPRTRRRPAFPLATCRGIDRRRLGRRG